MSHHRTCSQVVFEKQKKLELQTNNICWTRTIDNHALYATLKYHIFLYYGLAKNKFLALRVWNSYNNNRKISSVKFIHLLRGNQEQLWKMQLYIDPLAGIKPVVLWFLCSALTNWATESAWIDHYKCIKFTLEITIYKILQHYSSINWDAQISPQCPEEACLILPFYEIDR